MPPPPAHPIATLLTRLRRDTRGATAVFLAVCLVPMLGMLGLSIDAALAYLMRARLEKALDTAALAAGRVALNSNADAIARGYFDANFGSAPGVKLGTFTYALDSTRQYVTLTVSATIPTHFMRLFGKDSLAFDARTVVRRQTTGLELALVLDNTGSMIGKPFNTMQAASLDLVAAIYGTETEIENLWISVIPFTATVNVGNQHTDWLLPADRAIISPADFSTQGWKGCVMAQTYPLDTDDTPPTVTKMTSFFYPATVSKNDNNWPPLKTALSDFSEGRGPNLNCGTPVTPLTASRAKVEAALKAMGAWGRGGTAGNFGLTWGWRTISPRWRGLWGSPSEAKLPLDYNSPMMRKVLIVLTDGNNQFYDHDYKVNPPGSDFTAYGRLEAMGVKTLEAGRTILDTRQAETCAAMKAEGIEIYSMIFGASPDTTARNLYQTCASRTSMYFYAPNNATLSAAFKSIAGDLAKLRIVE